MSAPACLALSRFRDAINNAVNVRSLMHYEQGEDVEWSTNYFGDYGFKRAGRFYEIGHKIGKVVNVVMFQYHTAEKIDPRAVPDPVSVPDPV